MEEIQFVAKKQNEGEKEKKRKKEEEEGEPVEGGRQCLCSSLSQYGLLPAVAFSEGHRTSCHHPAHYK